MRKILIILDGVADIMPNTSLKLSNHPNLDFLARHGKTGLMYPIKGIAPESGEAQFVLLGQSLSKYPGRGVLESLGIGLKIKNDCIYLRGNFMNIKNGKLTSRTTIPKGLVKRLNKISPDVKVIPTIDYRCIVVIKNASPNITNTHPGYIKINNHSNAVDSDYKEKLCSGDKATSEKINYFIGEVKKILKNKTIILRGAGNKIPRIKRLKNWSMIADMPVEYGLARLLGMKVLKRKDEINKILKCKGNVYVQIKDTDTPGHLGSLKNKINAIERIDKKLKPLTKLNNAIICITADHATPYQLRRHSKDPVPVLIYNKGLDKSNGFDESSCKNGSLNKIEGKNLLRLLQ